MKDTSHTARFTFTWTYSDRYHGEAEKRSHGQSPFTDSTADLKVSHPGCVVKIKVCEENPIFVQSQNTTKHVGFISLQKKERVLKPVTSYSKTITFH